MKCVGVKKKFFIQRVFTLYEKCLKLHDENKAKVKLNKKKIVKNPNRIERK